MLSLRNYIITFFIIIADLLGDDLVAILKWKTLYFSTKAVKTLIL